MKVIRVFIASPSDLAAERKALKQIADELNQSLRDLDCFIDLLGWEGRLPGFGRPQEQINEDVDCCELFVGVLWGRWGTPSGEFTSGFEEEFERAKSRRRQTDALPEIWLYFKDPNPERVADPGEQLRQVLAFRRQIEERRELFFKTFPDTEAWRGAISGNLLRYVIKRYKAGDNEAASGEATRAVSGLVRGHSDQSTYQALVGLVPAELRRISEVLQAAVAEARADQFQDKVTALGGGGIARLYLLAAAMAYPTTLEVLSNHAANLIYRHRDECEVTIEWEHSLLVASMLREGNENIPGWYWLKGLDPPVVGRTFMRLVTTSADEELRASILKMLAERPPLGNSNDEHEQLIFACLKSEGDRRAVLPYARRFGGQGTMERLVQLIETMRDDEGSKLKEVADAILCRLDPGAGLEEILKEGRTPSIYCRAELSEAIERLDERQLRQAFLAPHESLRFLAISELARRQQLTTDEAKCGLSDSSRTVKHAAVRHLIRTGDITSVSQITDIVRTKEEPATAAISSFLDLEDGLTEDSLIEELYRTFDREALEEEVRWYNPSGHVAYKVLGLKYFANIGATVHKDLRDGFQVRRNADKERLNAEYVARASAELAGLVKENPANMQLLQDSIAEAVKQLYGHDEFIEKQYGRAALSVLAVHGTAEDLEVARSAISSDHRDAREAALQIISRWGGETDVRYLVQLASDDFGDVAVAAASAALRLSTDPWATAMQFLQRGAEPFVEVGLKALDGHRDLSKRWLELEPLLSSKYGVVRSGVVRLLASLLDTVKLEAVMEKCLSSPTCYYNVVAGLDRELYGPEPWKLAS